MTQIEFDAAMQQINYEQMCENQRYNDAKGEIDLQISDIKLQMLDLRSKVQSLHIKKMAVQSEQKKMNQSYHERKHQFCVAHPRQSMEDAV